MKPDSGTKPDGLHKEIDGAMWEIDGVSVKLADALAKDLGRPLKIVTMQFRDLIPALKSGRIELIVASMTITEKRRKNIDFSDPYVHTGLGMLVRDNSEIQSLEDLEKGGRRALVRQATSAEEFVKRRMPNVKLEVIQESGMGERTVMGDTEAAFINDQLLLLRIQKLLAHRTRVLPKLLNEEYWGIGIRKGNEGMRVRVNAFLSRFRAEGGFQRLADSYLSVEQKFLAEQKLPPLFP
jgi:polar amino acid transport system substrate-binding protein